MDRFTVVVAVVLGVLIVATGLLVAPPDENRDPLPVPAPAAVAALDEDALGEATAAVEDRSGLRRLGVAFDSWLRSDVLGERVFDRHIVGDDGWWFLRAAVEGSCEDPAPVAAIGVAAVRLAAVARAVGLELAVVVPPDKSAIYPERLGRFEKDGLCRRADIRAIERVGPPVVTGLLDAFIALPEDDPGPAYFRRDTHWRHIAAAEASRPVYDLVAPEALDHLRLVELGTADRNLDLQRFSGETVVIQEPVWALRPDGATVIEEVYGRSIEHFRSEGPTVPDRDVVFVRDSFGRSMLPSLAHLGARMTACNCNGQLDGRVAGALQDAEVLVVEVVQREAGLRLVEQDVAGHLVTALGTRLSGAELSVASDGSVRLPESGAIRFAFDGTPDVVRVLGGEGEVLRELTISGGQVAALFVEDVSMRDVVVTVEGARLTGAEAVDLR